MKQGREGGFTLIELVVVIVILGVLAAVGIAAYTQATRSSDHEAGTTQLRELGGEATALSRGEERYTPTHLARAAADTHRVILVTRAAEGRAEVSYLVSASGQTLALAQRTGGGDCARLTVTFQGMRPGPTTGTTCAPLLPAGEVPAPAGAETAPPAPTNLAGERASGSVSLHWDPVNAPGVRYEVSIDRGAPTLTTDTRYVASGLVNGVFHRFDVQALTETGLQSPAAELGMDARPAGVWDAALSWAYDNNTICYGGSSSWSYELRASITAGRESAYRVRIHTVNQAAAGTDPWVEYDLAVLQPGLAQVPAATDRQVCAPQGNPNPPFTSVEVVEAATGTPAVLQKSGARSIPAGQIVHERDGAPVPPPGGITP